MSKETSLMLKGVAILMMLFLHLFNSENLLDSCNPSVFIGDVPLVYILTRTCAPVGFFLLLSGYGLDYIYFHGGNMTWRKQGKRLLKLYITYWIILAIFVSIGSYVRPDKYPGDWLKAIGNITSWHSSYNSEHWFLFPYACLSLTALYIFKILDKLGQWKSLVFFIFLDLVCGYIISRYIAVEKSYDSVFAHLITYLELTLCFVIGAFMHRAYEKNGLKIKRLEGKNVLTLCLLLCLMFLQSFIKTSAFGFVYVFCFFMLFLQLHISKVIGMVLQFLGKYSMVMWLTHSFFCYHIFHDFIYGFSSPILIFLVLVIVSVLVSIPIKYIADNIIKRVGL